MPTTLAPPHTCPACGDTRPAPAAPARRVVAVLFVDIVGFTTLVDALEPEEVHALQQDYFEIAAQVVRAYGGLVEKYVGDAVMALFGADDAGDGLFAYQAVQSALRIQEQLAGRPLAGRHPVRTRAAVATGDAVVDPAGAARGYGLVSGSIVTTAARLQAYAPHGTTVVDAYTRHATAAMIAYQDLPPVAAPGKPRPLPLWRALPPHRASHRVCAERVAAG